MEFRWSCISHRSGYIYNAIPEFSPKRQAKKQVWTSLSSDDKSNILCIHIPQSPQFYNMIINLMPTSSRARVLSTNANAPPVTKTTMATNLLHQLNIITKLGIKVLRTHLVIRSRSKTLLFVQELNLVLEPNRHYEIGKNLFNLLI